MIEVTKEEFFARLPADAKREVITICEPVAFAYEVGEKVVGIIWLYEEYPRDGIEPYVWAPNVHKLDPNLVTPPRTSTGN